VLKHGSVRCCCSAPNADTHHCTLLVQLCLLHCLLPLQCSSLSQQVLLQPGLELSLLSIMVARKRVALTATQVERQQAAQRTIAGAAGMCLYGLEL
jgi:hypothetical protein